MLTDEVRGPRPHGVPVRGSRPAAQGRTPARVAHRLRHMSGGTTPPGGPDTPGEPGGAADGRPA